MELMKLMFSDAVGLWSLFTLVFLGVMGFGMWWWVAKKAKAASQAGKAE